MIHRLYIYLIKDLVHNLYSMDVIPFINRNGLWNLDMPELINPDLTFTNQLVIVERNFVELLDTLANNKLPHLNLEFHYEYFNPYDAKLIRRGSSYICESIFYKQKNTLLWFPTFLPKAMKTNDKPEIIYIKVQSNLT